VTRRVRDRTPPVKLWRLRCGACVAPHAEALANGGEWSFLPGEGLARSLL